MEADADGHRGGMGGGLIRPGGVFMTTQALLILGYTNAESLCACSRVPRVGFLDCNRRSVNKVKYKVEPVQHPAMMSRHVCCAPFYCHPSVKVELQI